MTSTEYKQALGRPISFALEKASSIIRRTILRMSLDRPKIGRPDFTYERCGSDDWVDGFWPGQLWLAHILNPLTADYSLLDHPTAEGLLRCGAEWASEGLCDTMLPYGDYFYVEALARQNGLKQFFW